MVAIGPLPLSLKITPKMGGLLIIERSTGPKAVKATGRTIEACSGFFETQEVSLQTDFSSHQISFRAAQPSTS